MKAGTYNLPPMFPKPVIAIVGSGSIGGYYGGRLARHGHDVHFLLRSDFDAVTRNGWTVRSAGGDFRLSPDRFHGHRDPRKFPPVDLVIVTLKATSVADYRALIGPLLGFETAILTLQNGLGNEEVLAGQFGAERVIGGLAWICSTRTGPGVIEHTFGGKIQISDLVGGDTPRARAVAELFNSSDVEAEVLDDVRTGKWRKLGWNVAFSGLGALLGLSTDRVLATDAGVQFVSALVREIIAIAAAQDIEIPAEFAEQIVPFTRGMGAYRTSMQIDRESGRPMELETIFAAPLRYARDLGVPCPRLSALYELLKLVDARRQ
jgi:2-dehydropantoate 2-reductase